MAAPRLGLVLVTTPLAPSLNRRRRVSRDHTNRETVNTAVYPEIRLKPVDNDQVSLPLVTEGVLRYLWQSKYGSILIEVVGDKTFVNGLLVELVSS